MKKWVSLFMAVVMAAVLLAGCAGKKNETAGPQTGAASSAAKEVVHLKFWGGVPPEQGPAEVIENWNRANPDIQVEYERFVNDDAGNTKLETALLGGQLDLFMNYRTDRAVKRVEVGMTAPLDEFIEKDGFDLKANFNDDAIMPINGKIHFIPAILINAFVVLNKQRLDDAGLPVPKEWTWDEYMTYAEKLTQGEGADKVWGSYLGGPTPNIYEYVDKAAKVTLGPDWLYKADGTSNFDAPEVKQILDNLVRMEQQMKVQMPYAEALVSKTQGHQLFMSEKTAMLWWATAVIRSVKDTKSFPHEYVTAFAPQPKLAADDRYNTSGTGYFDLLSISSASEHKEEAWKFLKWYVTEGNEPMIPFGRIPSWKLANQDEVLASILGENPEKLFDVESFKRVFFEQKGEIVLDTRFDKMPELQKILVEEAELALMGEQTTDKAISNMKSRSDQILLKK